MMQDKYFQNRVTKLFQIQYPIVQAGMVWCSGWKLASAVSNAGALGLIGAGSMHPETLIEHLEKCKKATSKPFGVNVPLLYPEMKDLMQILVDQGVKIVFTSAGNPATWTGWLKDKGIIVVHVVSSTKFAMKAETAGVDAIVAEGFEAGGHNGREETTSLCLIPAVSEAVSIPVIAAGGFATGKSMLAGFALGAEGIQVGTRFAACAESSAHENFKNRIRSLSEGDTELVMKKLTPVRLIKNEFYQQIKKAELQGASAEELQQILGMRRAKAGMFEGNMQEGELEIGQVASMVKAKETATEIVQNLWSDFLQEHKKLTHWPF